MLMVGEDHSSHAPRRNLTLGVPPATLESDDVRWLVAGQYCHNEMQVES